MVMIILLASGFSAFAEQGINTKPKEQISEMALLFKRVSYWRYRIFRYHIGVLENSWNKSFNGDSLSFYETDAVAKGYTYRLSVTAKVAKDGVTETVNTSVEGKY